MPQESACAKRTALISAIVALCKEDASAIANDGNGNFEMDADFL